MCSIRWSSPFSFPASSSSSPPAVARSSRVVPRPLRRSPGASRAWGGGRWGFWGRGGGGRARARRAGLVDGAAGLASEPVALRRRRPEVEQLVEPLERLGVATLGQLVALGRPVVADRFGRAGELA